VGEEQRLVVPTTENLEAYNLYLKGRFFYYRFTEADLKRGIEFFEQALAKDPNYAKAHAGIADCWSFLADDWVVPDEAYPKAKAAAMRALDLDPSLAEAFTAMGRVLSWYEWDFPGAERELAKAVKLNPNSAEAHFVYGSTLPCVGKLDEAIEEMRQALILDPLSPLYCRWIGRFQLFAGNYDATIEQAKKTLEMVPDYYQAFLDLGAAHLGKGNPEKGLEWYQRAQSLGSSVRSYDAHLVRALAALGQEEEAAAILERLEQEGKEHYLRAEIVAMGYTAVGDLDRAFACLDEALQARSAGLIYVHVDPSYEPLRSDPRLAELSRKVGVK
jgi:tetratricopeptide (TPR) repeat protein